MQLKFRYTNGRDRAPEVVGAQAQNYDAITQAAIAYLGYRGGGTVQAFVASQDEEGQWIPWGTYSYDLYDSPKTFTEKQLSATRLEVG